MITKEDILKKEKLLAELKSSFAEENRMLAEKAVIFEQADIDAVEAAYNSGKISDCEWQEYRRDYYVLAALVRRYEDKSRYDKEYRLQKKMEDDISAMKKEYRKQKVRSFFNKT